MVYLIRYKMLGDGEEVLCDAPYMQLESEVIFFILISLTHSPHTYYDEYKLIHSQLLHTISVYQTLII